MSSEVESTVLDSWSSVWRDVTPWMDAFIHDASTQFITRCFPDILASEPRAPVKAGIVNELAYALVVRAWETDGHPRDIVDLDSQYPQLVSESVDRVRVRSGDGQAELSRDGRNEALKIAMRLHWMLRARVLTGSDQQAIARFRYRIAGSGFIGPLEADMLVGGLLIEIKAGQRSVQSRDMRQLLLYAAMLSEGGHDLDSLCWVNPRRGEVLRLSTEEISSRVSGCAWYELRGRIVSAFGLALSK